jgi:FlaA1/EpsC-like NDP-sugar epimerase
LGGLSDLPLLIAKLGLKAAVVCLPASKKELLAQVLAVTDGTRLDLRVIPSVEDLLSGRGAETERVSGPTRFPATPRTGSGQNGVATTYAASPAIDLGELIGRTPYQLDREAVAKVLTGKRVLITGAGGSIGSELARVAAEFAPEQLILMERAENALFEIDRQTARRCPKLARKAVLHDVVDAEGTLRLLADLRPHVVFHAAAHKHVPLMEDHPGHAITNNLFGTKSIADASVAVGAERFVMISSDKAVNPTSVMGATKRLAELYVRGLGRRGAEHGTRLSMVRFGNVLGSACSVLTIWSTQLSEGGPITITDPRMTRFFMTIPEAATLVVQSTVVGDATSAKAAVGVYVLDMGEPIRIVDLAARFVRAHGLWPRFVSAGATPTFELPGNPLTPPTGAPTIDVVFSGARPGEKLHEELAYAAEALRPTGHPGVRSWAGPGFGDADVAQVQEMVTELGAARFSQSPTDAIRAIRRHVPEMRPSTSPGK